MKAVRFASLALVTVLGLSLFAGNASAGGFTDAVKGQIRQQLNTPQQTPITKTIRGTKKVTSAVANKAFGVVWDYSVRHGKKN